MTVVKLIVDKKDPSFIVGNTTVLDEDEIIYLSDGRHAFGDGVTQIRNLTYFGSTSAPVTSLLTGGVITVGTYGGTGVLNDIRVTVSTFYISGQGSFSAIQTDFLDIALSSAGTQRYAGLYGGILGTITKVEGSEAALAVYPTQPANTALIGYVLVSDASVATTADISGLLPKADKATSAEVVTGTNDAKYITPLGLAGAKDVTGGFVGMTLRKINFKNVLGNSTSFFTNANTGVRTYTFQDRDGTIADNTDLLNKCRLVARDSANSSSITGTTSETKIGTGLLIPAGSVVAGNVVSVRAVVGQVSASGNATIRIYIHTLDQLSGATLIGISTAAAFRLPISRRLSVESASSTTYLFTGENAINDFSTSGANANTATKVATNIDWTVGQYIITSFAPSVVGATSTRHFVDAIKE